MRLQSDPTMIYGITKGTAVLGRGLKKSELEAKTPYNTYQIDGLPPGPIANPGVDALKAVGQSGQDQLSLFRRRRRQIRPMGICSPQPTPSTSKNVAKFRTVERRRRSRPPRGRDGARGAGEAGGREAGEPGAMARLGQGCADAQAGVR